MKKLFVWLLCFSMIAGTCLSVPTYAATNSVDQTEYQTEISTDTDSDTEVELSVKSTFCVRIPKKIVLGGIAKQTTYQVSAKGDIGGNEILLVAPEPTITLYQRGKTDKTATITQTKTEWESSELSPTEYTSTFGTVIANNITAGLWAGTLFFTVRLIPATPNPTPPVTFNVWAEDEYDND